MTFSVRGIATHEGVCHKTVPYPVATEPTLAYDLGSAEERPGRHPCQVVVPLAYPRLHLLASLARTTLSTWLKRYLQLSALPSLY
jgi:hypothetical protein